MFVGVTPDVGPMVGYGVVDVFKLFEVRVVDKGVVTGSFKSVTVSSITEYLYTKCIPMNMCCLALLYKLFN